MNKKLSVLVNTLNEEDNISNCLESVKWADEIIILDMHSDDKTIEIAKNYTDKIFFMERKGYVEAGREYVLEKATNNWVLIIDADEIVSKRMKDRISRIIEDDEADIIYVPRKNYFFGYLMKGGGFGPLQDLHPRVFKKWAIKFKDIIHDSFIINKVARVCKINNPEECIIHFNYLTVDHFIEKMNKYTTIEALNIYEGKKQDVNMSGIHFKMVKEFFGRYIKHFGIRDGFLGMALSILLVMYRLITYMKLKLIKQHNTKETKKSIKQKYNKIAKKIISEY